MDVPAHVDALQAAGHRLVEVAATTAPDTPVPTCPGWTVRDLVRHLGGIHAWATIFVAERRVEPIAQDLEELVGGWPPDTELVGWYGALHRRLVATLAAAPPDLECFTFLAAPSPLAMWARRQAHETSIHRIDAEAAVGQLTAFPAGLAADGIDELLTAFLTRPGRGPRAPQRTALLVEPVDHVERWLVTFDEHTCRTERHTGHATGPADATVTGAATDLYAWVWNRPSIGAVSIYGDETVAATWRATSQVRWR